MAAPPNGPSGELSLLLQHMKATCHRIDSRVSSWSTTGAMRSLIQLHIKNDVLPQMQWYHDSVVEMTSLCAEGRRAPELETMYHSRLSKFSDLIYQTLALLNLVDDKNGFDELNAYYAGVHIKGSDGSEPKDYQKLKHLRLASGVESWLGLAQHMPGSLADIISVLGPGLFELSQRTLDQLAPRYIHKYPGRPPYKWDVHAPHFNGSFGVVRKAVAELTGGTVAVKTINTLRKRDRDTVIRELGLLEVCDHPNVIRLVDAYETSEDCIHLVMTPWAPFTLLRFILLSDAALREACPWFKPGATMSNMIILKLMIGLAEGVEHLHCRSIKHKDIKPDNILLHLESSAKVTPIITDLGEGKIFKHGGATKYTDSTQAYLAPEQLELRESSLASDIWQLGCCFALVLGRACGAAAAVDRLWDSFENTRDRRSCIIAREIEIFMPVLRDVASVQQGLLGVVCGMLQTKTTDRWDVNAVRSELYRLRDSS